MIDVIGGMGKSAPSRPSKKGLAYGQWAAEVLERLELKRASMIGASQGGWLIAKLGNVAPEAIESATLMSSAGFLPLSMIQVFRMLPRVLFKPPAENVVIAEIVPGVGHSMIHRQPDWVISRVLNFLERYAR